MAKLSSPTRAAAAPSRRRSTPPRAQSPTLDSLFPEKGRPSPLTDVRPLAVTPTLPSAAPLHRKIEKRHSLPARPDQNPPRNTAGAGGLRQRKIVDILTAEPGREGFRLDFRGLRQTRLRFPVNASAEEEACKPTAGSLTTASHFSPWQAVDSCAFDSAPTPRPSPLCAALPRPVFFDPELNVQFRVIGVLGQGAFATVRECECRKSGRRVAVKSYNHQSLQAGLLDRAVQNEIRVLRSARHPNLIELAAVSRTRSHTHLVLELFRGQTLEELLRGREGGRLEESLARPLFAQVVLAVLFLHGRRVYHRDLKVENVMVDAASGVKLIDFGFAMDASLPARRSLVCGTPNYMAPEAAAGVPADPAAAEAWSLGVLLHRLVCGDFPFKPEQPADPRSRLRHVYARPAAVSDALHALLAALFEPNPARRLSLDALARHAWLAT